MINTALYGIEKIAYIVVSMAILSSCATEKVEDIDAQNYFSDITESQYRIKNTHPKLGLALAGGGSKAAAFGMGVLAGLNDAGVLTEVDIISSVSGGSYASYFYFSKLLSSRKESEKQIDIGLLFNSCMLRGQDYFGGKDNCFAGEAGIPSVGLQMKDQGDPLDAAFSYQKVCPEPNVDVFYKCQEIDEYKYQNHLMGRLDFLNDQADYSLRNANNNRKAYANTSWLLVQTIPTLPFHWFFNGIFDWRITISPSQTQYQHGIERGYGYTPTDYQYGDQEDGWQEIEECKDDANLTRCGGGSRGINWTKYDREIESQQFSSLKELYLGSDDVPLWIINTTNVSDPLIGSSENVMLNNIFEFTPFSYGSAKQGYINEPISEVEISDIVLASAAFFDYQQSNYPWINPLLRAGNLYWGINIRNPLRTDSERTFHKFLPFPFYTLHPGWSRSGDEPLYFHLSDGGQSDNLGVVSLIRRKTRNIIVADHSADKEARMEDFCRAANAGINGDPAFGVDISGRPLYRWILVLPGEKLLPAMCDQWAAGKNVVSELSVYKWSKPVVFGIVKIMKNDGSDKLYSEFAEEVGKVAENGLCPIPNHETANCLNIYWLKPAYDISLFEKARKCFVGEWKDLNRAKLDAAKACLNAYMLSDIYRIKYPSSLVAFYLNNESFISETKSGSYFPQDSTVINTINSSPTIYGAYRDLGRFYAYLAAKYYTGNTQDISKLVLP